MTDSTISQRGLIFLLSSIALITLPHIRHIPAPLFAFFTLMLAWRALGIWRNDWLPPRLLLLLLTLLGIALLVSQQRSIFGRDAGTSVFVVALGLKMLEIHSKRDVYLIVYLAFIVAATQFLYEYSILMAGYILLVSTVLLATLIMQSTRQTQTVQALKMASSIILQALPLAIVIFVLFPRVESPRWRWLEDDNKAQSGLSNTLEPGSISALSLSDELVFRARFDGNLPPPEQRYWRGPVYSQTDGIRWTTSGKVYQQTQQPVFSGSSYRYTLLMEPQKERWVFALDMAQDFEPTVRRNTTYQLITTQNPGNRAEYRITSYPNYNTSNIDNHEYSDNLRLPAQPSARVRKLIEQLKGFEAKPEQFIQNLLQFFRKEAFSYTLTPPLLPENPVETFLFETRSGYCSHYATAFVYLLRAAKIPARVVGGYQGGEFNEMGGFLEIRQADAHAWAEVWLEDKGWVRFDPTAAIAPERIERGVNVELQIASGAVNFAPSLDAETLNWLKRSRQLWQSVDYSWQRWVINYNARNQMQFLGRLGITDFVAIAKWLMLSIALITLVLAWWLLKQKTMATDQALRLYRKYCDKLAKAGIVIELGEGAKSFAERAKHLRPDLATQIETITGIFIRLRYEPHTGREDLQRLRKSIGDLKL